MRARERLLAAGCLSLLATTRCFLPELTIAPDLNQMGGFGGDRGLGGDSSLGGQGGQNGAEPRCAPGERVCLEDKVVLCAEDGNAASTVETCASDQSCAEGECRDHQCSPGTEFCVGDELRTCAENGLSSVLHTECTEEQYCDADEGACRDGTCKPLEPACDDNRATVCNEDGSGFSGAGTACDDGTTCDAGVCVEHVCSPLSTWCEDDKIIVCAENGLSSSEESECADDEYCAESDGDASCHDQVCAPTTTTCDDNVVMICNTQGSGYGTGADCTITNDTCIAGSCQGVCAPGQRTCSGTQPQECGANGTWENSGTPCQYVCTGQGQCTGVCVPGSRRCTGSGNLTHQTCSATGTWGNSAESLTGAAGCNTYHRDVDDDDYGRSGDSRCYCGPVGEYRATVTGDCCDTDDRARPNQGSCFTSPNNCGNYDYNCVSGATKCNIDGVHYNQCANNCDHTPGWESLAGCSKTCGASGNWHDQFPSFGCTGYRVRNLQQPCQ